MSTSQRAAEATVGNPAGSCCRYNRYNVMRSSIQDQMADPDMARGLHTVTLTSARASRHIDLLLRVLQPSSGRAEHCTPRSRRRSSERRWRRPR